MHITRDGNNFLNDLADNYFRQTPNWWSSEDEGLICDLIVLQFNYVSSSIQVLFAEVLKKATRETH